MSCWPIRAFWKVNLDPDCRLVLDPELKINLSSLLEEHLVNTYGLRLTSGMSFEADLFWRNTTQSFWTWHHTCNILLFTKYLCNVIAHRMAPLRWHISDMFVLNSTTWSSGATVLNWGDRINFLIQFRYVKYHFSSRYESLLHKWQKEIEHWSCCRNSCNLLWHQNYISK